MQNVLLALGGVGIIFAGIGLFLTPKPKFKIYKKLPLVGIGKPSNLGLPFWVAVNGKFALFARAGEPILLRKENENYIKIRIFLDGKEIPEPDEYCQQTQCFSGYYAGHSIKLCAKHDFLEVLCTVHSTVTLMVEKGRTPFEINVKRDIVKFDDFALHFECNGEYVTTTVKNAIRFDVSFASKIKLDFSSLGLKTLTNSQIRNLARGLFGMPRLDRLEALPNFCELRSTELAGKFARQCLLNQSYLFNFKQGASIINLSELGFTKWVTLSQSIQGVVVQDLFTLLKVKFKTQSQKTWLSCVWGEVRLNFDLPKLEIQSPVMVVSSRLNLDFIMPWQKLDIAKKLLNDMRVSQGRQLKDPQVAHFILSCLPLALNDLSPDVEFVRAVLPYIKHNGLRRQLLFFLQKHEQMFYIYP